MSVCWPWVKGELCESLTRLIQAAITQRLLAPNLLAGSQSRRFWVGFSGGVDSTCLLYHAWQAFCQQKVAPEQRWQLAAVHVHHGVCEAADRWADHCAQVCDHWGIKLVVRYVQPSERQPKGIEADLRALRYRAFADVASGHAGLLLAHHQVDQAETLLLRLLRGTGLMGLQGMRAVQPMWGLLLLRPWLSVSKHAIVAAARTADLKWIEDDSNQDVRLRRNFVRTRVMPVLQQQWPGVEQTLARVAHLAATKTSAPAMDVQQRVSCSRDILSLQVLEGLSEEALRDALYLWLRGLADIAPAYQRVSCLLAEVVRASPSAMPEFLWQGRFIRRFADCLWWVPPMLLASDQRGPMGLAQAPLGLEVCWSRSRMAVNLPLASLEVRYACGGEVVALTDGGHQKIKKYFQAQCVPPWLRAIWPLIYYQDELVMLPYLWVDPRYRVASGQLGWDVKSGEPALLQWLSWRMPGAV